MMEYNYSAYTKLINNQTFYFVKKYLIFSELEGVAPVLIDYGMHIDFYKACSIAAVNERNIMIQLFKEAQETVQQAKLIDFSPIKFSKKNFKR